MQDGCAGHPAWAGSHLRGHPRGAGAVRPPGAAWMRPCGVGGPRGQAAWVAGCPWGSPRTDVAAARGAAPTATPSRGHPRGSRGQKHSEHSPSPSQPPSFWGASPLPARGGGQVPGAAATAEGPRSGSAALNGAGVAAAAGGRRRFCPHRSALPRDLAHAAAAPQHGKGRARGAGGAGRGERGAAGVVRGLPVPGGCCRCRGMLPVLGGAAGIRGCCRYREALPVRGGPGCCRYPGVLSVSGRCRRLQKAPGEQRSGDAAGAPGVLLVPGERSRSPGVLPVPRERSRCAAVGDGAGEAPGAPARSGPWQGRGARPGSPPPGGDSSLGEGAPQPPAVPGGAPRGQGAGGGRGSALPRSELPPGLLTGTF
ncbi:hypothetical protein LUU34_01186800 [Aix galericulata]|nr:hypothetical protein LUU34_01186800 [Aix galericulata]